MMSLSKRAWILYAKQNELGSLGKKMYLFLNSVVKWTVFILNRVRDWRAWHKCLPKLPLSDPRGDWGYASSQFFFLKVIFGDFFNADFALWLKCLLNEGFGRNCSAYGCIGGKHQIFSTSCLFRSRLYLFSDKIFKVIRVHLIIWLANSWKTKMAGKNSRRTRNLKSRLSFSCQ